MDLLGRDKRIFIFVIMPLFISAIFLMIINSAQIAVGADKTDCYCQEREFTDTEVIYKEGVECADCKCWKAGEEKLFAFYGTDADCEKKETEEERYRCYKEYSHRTYICGQIKDEEEREKCFDKYPDSGVNAYIFYQGNSGTFVNEEDMTINGVRTYFTGFDRYGEHKIMTGFLEPTSRVMTLRDASRDIEFGNDMNVNVKYTKEEGRDGTLILLSNYGGTYFTGDVSYDEIDYKVVKNLPYSGLVTKNLKGMGMIDNSRGNGIDTSDYLTKGGYSDLLMYANWHNLMSIPDTDRADDTKIGGDPIEFKKGIEVAGDTRMEEIYFQDNKLLWFEHPIRGNWILYYPEWE